MRHKVHTVDGLALCQVRVVGTGEKAVSISPYNALDVAV